MNPDDSRSLMAACDRLLKTEREVLAMPKWASRWFMAKSGHRDCFEVARALKSRLLDEGPAKTALPRRETPVRDEMQHRPVIY